MIAQARLKGRSRTRHYSTPADFKHEMPRSDSAPSLLPSCNSIDVYDDYDNPLLNHFDDIGMESNLWSNKPKKSKPSMWRMPFTVHNMFS